jgi:predicted secreted Zn-dependent protease
LWTSWQKDYRSQNLLCSQTHALNRFTTAYTANTKIKQIANVHECSWKSVPCSRNVHNLRLRNLLSTKPEKINF